MSIANIDELERAVGNSIKEKPHLMEDVTEIRYLLEKVENLRSAGKDFEADMLQRRVNKKVIEFIKYLNMFIIDMTG